MTDALIITYYDAPNYGAFLQAHAMQSFLRENGVDAYICAHNANKQNLITLLLDARTPKDVVAYRKKLEGVIAEEKKKLTVSRDKKHQYALAIIGSDEVWNVRNLTAVHYPLFFRRYRNAEKTVSYAACCGNCTASDLKKLPYFRQIDSLDAISVRDDQTEQVILTLTGRSPERVLDPTFLYDFSQEIPARQIDEPYLLVYTYGLSKEGIDKVRAFCREHQLLLVATGSECPWADQNPMPSAFEWLSLIRHSQYVVTSTFHGSVFSIIFRKQFATVETRSRKVLSLMKEMKLTDRCLGLEAYSRLGALLPQPVHYDEAHMEERIAHSKNFILSQMDKNSGGGV